jgi:hypothetical protein
MTIGITKLIQHYINYLPFGPPCSSIRAGVSLQIDELKDGDVNSIVANETGLFSMILDALEGSMNFHHALEAGSAEFEPSYFDS